MKRLAKCLVLPFLAILLSVSSASAQKGIWAGAEIITDHKGNNGINYFAGYFRKKDQVLYIAPYLQAGYMPKMSFNDSGIFKYLSMEPGVSAVLQFDAFKVKLGAAAVQYIALDLSSIG